MNLNKRLRLFLLTGFIAAPVSAVAAGFDCRRAESEIEQAICRNEELSGLDSRLTAVYKELLAAVGDDGGAIRKSQRDWMKDGFYREANPRESCLWEKSPLEPCLIDVYQQRIRLFSAMVESIKTGGSKDSGSRYELKHIARKYDFVIQTFHPCERNEKEDYSSCASPAVVWVFRKGENRPLQAIPMQNVFFSFSRSNAPLTNSAALYDYQGVINVGDFNFDGEEDFAVQNGNHGSYGGPSYDVYLFSKRSGSFKYNGKMSNLIEDTLGFFEVDNDKKRIATLAKSGCCYHERTVYKVVNDIPVPVSRSVNDAATDPRYTYLYDEKWIGGKWKRMETQQFRQESYCEEELENAAQSSGHYTGASENRMCKPLPYAKKQGVVALQYPTGGNDQAHAEKGFKKGLDVFLVNLNGGDILGTYSEPNEFRDDRLNGLDIDTAPYLLRADTRAFGVRSFFYAKGGKDSFTLLTLFIHKEAQLVPVLRHIVMQKREENVVTIRTLSMKKPVGSNYADIVVHEAVQTFPDASKEKRGTAAAPTVSRRDVVLRFDGREYAVPDDLMRYP